MNMTQAALVPAGVRATEVFAVRKGLARTAHDWVAEECAVALVFNGISHAVMMATPADLEDFATGFALSEGLIEDRTELRSIEVVPVADGIEVQLEVSAQCEWRLRSRRRSMAGRTGCGLCGTDSLAAVRQPITVVEALEVSAGAITRALQALPQWQAIQRVTGATHAAAWCDLDGVPLIVREDVGRHNALDKVIGAMVRNASDARAGFICVTSRASFEIVQKAARAGIAVLAAVSAPTALAVEIAAASGQLLLGFVRGNDLVAYTHAGRLHLPAAALPRLPEDEA